MSQLDMGGDSSAAVPVPSTLVNWIWNSRNVKRVVGDNQWVEIEHTAFAGDVGVAWYYMATGSAVWWNVGKTISYKDHPELVTDMLNTACHDEAQDKEPPASECEKDFEQAFQTAKNRGYTSVQIVEHYDCQCGTPGHSSYKYKGLCQTEIVDLGGHGEHAGCASDKYKAGWQASKLCECDTTKQYTHCKGFGSHAVVGLVAEQAALIVT